MKSIIEHVVLFKIKEEASQSQIHSFEEQVNSLVSLEQPLHLTMGPLTAIQSSSISSFTFTHILHIRFSSKEDLHAYAVHPTHVSVVNDNKSLVVDKMALDWVTEVHGDDLVLPVESALRVVFFKLKEGLGEEGKEEVLKGVNGIQRGKAVQFTCGENFSDGRSKGFSIGSLAVFPGVSELKEVDSDEEFRKYDEIKENLDTVLVLDYVGHGQTAS
ncbi:unnamed protein product [Lathyrus sativus]|nr:unnamed protein product [Lathyrus sativus]